MVLSDEPGSSARIAEFSAGMTPWMVAVRMVSEGVDVPRLSVGVYATTTATPLYFAQAVGRFVRARRKGETASIFVPSVPRLLALASDLEAERDHVIGRPIKDEADLFAAEAEMLVGAVGRGRLRRPQRSVRRARQRRLVRPARLRRRQVRLRRAHRQRRRAGLPRHPRSARTRPGRRSAAPVQVRSAAKDARPDPEAQEAAVFAAPRRPAPHAARPRRRLAPPHRSAARRHARPAAQDLRRPGRAAGVGRRAAAADRSAAAVGAEGLRVNRAGRGDGHTEP